MSSSHNPSGNTKPFQTARGNGNYWKMAIYAGLLLAGVLLGSVSSRYLASVPSNMQVVPTSTSKPAESDLTLNFSKDKQAAVGLQTAPVAYGSLTTIVWRTGKVAVNEEKIAHISPFIEGIIRDVPVRIGQTVKAGDVLAVLDCRELSTLKLELYKARASYAIQMEQTVYVKNTMQNAEKLLKLLAEELPVVEIEKQMADKPVGEWRSQLMMAYSRRNQLRSQLLSQRSSPGSISEATVRRTESEADAASASYTALLEELRHQVKYQAHQADLKLREAESAIEINKAKLIAIGMKPEEVEKVDPIAEGDRASLVMIKAPFAGTIVEKHAVLSERVGPTFQMFVISDLSTVWIQADVFESDLGIMRHLTDKYIRFKSAVAKLSEQKAKVIYTGDLIDKSSRTTSLIAEALNPDRQLKLGMFVEVGFESGEEDKALLIPSSAILYIDNKPVVFVQTKEDEFQKKQITLGKTGDAGIEVVGLRAGEKVVIKGGFVLKSELLKEQMVGE